MERLKRQNLDLTEHECIVAGDVADPTDIDVTWQDVGGLEDTVAMLQVQKRR